ncbi:hypothetical protein FIBSPDRAFT_607638 [Athelia psychrophila]|uniref:Uncharacterized protein n=1 Tax=Athelia psychrophila TaxID=1759441 RepID=A0A166GGL8_9AGAM|nr:hypothetical protein FIBSPDRAFT_607638 [Fibularhizoctonia sp. CBS 109695]
MVDDVASLACVLRTTSQHGSINPLTLLLTHRCTHAASQALEISVRRQLHAKNLFARSEHNPTPPAWPSFIQPHQSHRRACHVRATVTTQLESPQSRRYGGECADWNHACDQCPPQLVGARLRTKAHPFGAKTNRAGHPFRSAHDQTRAGTGQRANGSRYSAQLPPPLAAASRQSFVDAKSRAAGADRAEAWHRDGGGRVGDGAQDPAAGEGEGRTVHGDAGQGAEAAARTHRCFTPAMRLTCLTTVHRITRLITQ